MFGILSPVGTITVVSTLPAFAGPAFLTVTFSVKLLPLAALVGPLIVILRSASLEAVVMLTGSPLALLLTEALFASPL